MPDVLPNIPQEPAQGIQAQLDLVYLFNADAANAVIDAANNVIEEINKGGLGLIKPYSSMVAPVKQYAPTFYNNGLYIANEDISVLPSDFDPAQWTLIATKVDGAALEAQIQAEEDARVAEDAILQGNIDSEAGARAQADTALGNRITAEETARSGADSNLQQQIDAITAASDVKDIVGTHAELENYDTSTLGDNDIIKVLQDETQQGATTYYRWDESQDQFELIGSEGPYYTKAQADSMLAGKQNTLTAGTGISIDTNNEISVADPVLVNKSTGANSLNILGGGGFAISSTNSTSIGFRSSSDGNYDTSVGAFTNIGSNAMFATVVGAYSAVDATGGTAIGASTSVTALCAIQMGAGGDGARVTNSDANTFKVANANGNFEIMSADGTIPEARLADTTNAARGDVLTLDSNLNAVWQASGGGLPSQTGNAGKFLTTDGTGANWGTTVEDAQLVIKNTAGSRYSPVNQISFYAKYNNSDGTAATISSTTVGTLRISGTSCAFDGDLMFASSGKNIGTSSTKLGRIYVENINNGADIAVPTTGGTMACVEDLPVVMTGADGTNAGTSGLVPAPAATDNDKFLAGDGTWKAVSGGATYTAGTGINIDANNEISVTAPVLVNKSTATSQNLIINGYEGAGVGVININSPWNVSSVYGNGAVNIGGGSIGTAVGTTQTRADYAIQLGGSNPNYNKNTEPKTLCVGFSGNEQYKLLDSDGTIPVARMANIIDDTSTTATGQTWSADKLNTMIGDIETLINAL